MVLLLFLLLHKLAGLSLSDLLFLLSILFLFLWCVQGLLHCVLALGSASRNFLQFCFAAWDGERLVALRATEFTREVFNVCCGCCCACCCGLLLH